MKNPTCLTLIALVVLTGKCWAYGGGGGSSTKACDKPKFSEFTPAANAQAAAGEGFSFVASKNTYPTTIKVTVKDRPATVTTEEKADGTFLISGKLPEGLKATYARVAITADAQSNCKGAGGWLLKIK